MIEIKFDKPYQFEDESHDSIVIDLESMTTRDLIKIESKYKREVKNASAVKELDTQFIILVAVHASGKVVEFFDKLPIKEMAKIKGEVIPFLMNAGE